MTGCNLRTMRSHWECALLVVMGLAALSLIAGCGGAPRQVLRTEFVPFTPEQKSALESKAGNQYRIQEGDVLKIYFAFERDLNQDGVVVLSDGSVSLAGVDPVLLAGKTIAEADSLLTAAYSRDYREPALSVMVQETQGRRVYLTGQVRVPGYYPVPLGGTDVMGAIATAGGFTEDADEENAVIVRVTREGYQFQQVDLSSFGTAGFVSAAAIVLQPYDIVYVPRNGAGDFGYLTRTVLTGLGTVTRMAYDLYNVINGVGGRY